MPRPRNGDRIVFCVPGRPQPKERPRRGRYGNWYTPRATKRYEQLVGSVAAWKLGQQASRWDPARGEYEVHIIVQPAPRTRPDLDNVAKSVLDGLTGVVYADDRQVVAHSVRRATPQDRLDVGILVEVVRVRGGGAQGRRRHE